jgi:hypothetical protein
MPELKEILNPRNLNLPDEPRVEGIQFEPYVDSIGDPALQVNVVLEPFRIGERRWKYLEPIENEIFRALQEAGVDRWPYVRFVTAEDLAQEAAQA